uniref:Transcriptional regulator n=1 Tax=Steinernema glaseri TaxID=37863 RepID=A0A1I7YT34_9BILA
MFERRVYLCSIHQTNVMKACLVQNNLTSVSNTDIRERLKAHVARLPEVYLCSIHQTNVMADSILCACPHPTPPEKDLRSDRKDRQVATPGS